MKHFTQIKGLILSLVLTVCPMVVFGQKYTGLTATASDGTTPTVIFDGNYGSRWQDASNTDNASLVVDLGSEKPVGTVKIYWEAANAKAYTLSFSTDNVNFAGDLTYTNMAAGSRTDNASGLSINCRYIKLQGVTRQLPYGYSIYEIEVYSPVTPVLTSLSLTPVSSTIKSGETKQLTLGGLDQLGNAFPLTSATTWSVDGSGATIGNDGLFSSVSKGLYTITATNSSLSAKVTVDVLPSTTNLSTTATATASSGTASSAIDNNAGTRWESLSTDPQWIMIDLGQNKLITDLWISWEAANAKDYIVEISDDATAWVNVATRTGMAAGARIDRLYDLNVHARYIRLTGTARNLTYGYSIYEFVVYGSNNAYTSLTNNEQSVTVYPNPAVDVVNLPENTIKADLFDSKGILVYSASNTRLIQVASLSSGIYFLRLSDVNGNVSSTKLMIR